MSNNPTSINLPDGKYTRADIHGDNPIASALAEYLPRYDLRFEAVVVKDGEVVEVLMADRPCPTCPDLKPSLMAPDDCPDCEGVGVVEVPPVNPTPVKKKPGPKPGYKKNK